MPTRPLLHGATGARIAATLRDDILDGVLVPGERIRQNDLAERQGASRLPVREALRMLESEGLVTLVANTGAWVSTLSSHECHELYLMRERLEPLLLLLNVPLVPESEIERLQHLAETMQDCDDVEQFLLLDREFHQSCLQFAQTTVLFETVHSLWNRTQHYRRAVTRLIYSQGDASVHHDHHLIVGALRRRDGEEVERVLAGHIRRTRLQLAINADVFSG